MAQESDSSETLCDTRCGWLKQHMKHECPLSYMWEMTDCTPYGGTPTWSTWFKMYCCKCEKREFHYIQEKILMLQCQNEFAEVVCLQCEELTYESEVISDTCCKCKQESELIQIDDQILYEPYDGDMNIYPCFFCIKCESLIPVKEQIPSDY